MCAWGEWRRLAHRKYSANIDRKNWSKDSRLNTDIDVFARASPALTLEGHTLAASSCHPATQLFPPVLPYDQSSPLTGLSYPLALSSPACWVDTLHHPIPPSQSLPGCVCCGNPLCPEPRRHRDVRRVEWQEGKEVVGFSEHCSPLDRTTWVSLLGRRSDRRGCLLAQFQDTRALGRDQGSRG